MTSRARRASAGFTLLEIVVAMAIVGLGIVTLLEIFSLGLRLGGRSTARTESMLDAGRVMDELFARPALKEGTERGKSPGGLLWKLEVRAVKPSDGELTLSSDWELKEVAVEMRSAGSPEAPVELRTLRLARKER
ncbi:MAG TPA: type II secretion system protein [candidate division Zixibacteria bacterium]|nr:type II secretion system protein [candidate division Zixibacteria bacterium]